MKKSKEQLLKCYKKKGENSMKKRITQKEFIEIFSNPTYRRKLDRIILNFFGIENTIEEQNTLKDEDILLEFILLINTEYTLKIIVKDTQFLFKESKKFYINLSYRKGKQTHELLMPGYWEIYCPYVYTHRNKNPKLFLIAALFSCETLEEIEKLFEKMEVFSKEEIKQILFIVKEENKDK